MYVKLYRFSKRKNSTAIPVDSGESATPSLVFDSAKINDGNTSIAAPSIRLPDRAQIDQVYLTQYNYCKITNWGRYYFIDDWQYNGDGTWTAICSIDVLATWKDEILASGGYLARSATATATSSPLADSLYPPTTAFVTAYNQAGSGFNFNPYEGTYVIGVLSKDNPNVGSASYYMVRRSDLATLVSTMMTTTSDVWGDITLTSDSAMKSIIDPMQYVVSCKWFPFSPPSVSYTDRIYLGSWNTTASGHKLYVGSGTPGTSRLVNSSQTQNISITEGGTTYNWGTWSYITLPYMAEDNDEGYFPIHTGYVNSSLITPWGVFDIPANILRNISIRASASYPARLYYRTLVDLVTGDGTFWVAAWPYDNNTTYRGKLVTILKRNIQIAKDIPLTQVTINNAALTKEFTGAAAGMGQALVSAFTADVGGLANGISGLINGVVDSYVTANSPTVKSTVNGTASITQDIELIQYEEQRYRTIPVDWTLTGKLRKVPISTLSGFTGYVQMDVTTFVAPCTDGEKSQVIEWLLNGVYIE